jgi:N-acetylglucosaminyl-diphospho-decaprenol L-rhamnosyltransferase|tara:strand:- start:4110 stop:4949 length:840 start_codon:yes stop_codon:yes gene_type:complete
MTFNQITIVITSYKSEEKILKCLKSVNNQCKIIVIENSQNTSFKKKIEENFTNVECFIAGQNLGYAKGNNLGLSKVKTKFALILNPDAELEKNTLTNFFNRVNNIKNFAIIGPATQDEKNMQNNFKEFREVNSVKGFAMFLNLDEFKDIGFFDDNFFIYLEEIDLCRRLRQKDKKIFVDPNILINHQGGSSHDEKYNFEMELSRNWHWMWSSFYYTKKHKGFFYALFYVLDKLISAVLKYTFYLLILKSSKKLIYKQRISGLINSIIGKPSWYRPFNNK